MPRLLSLWILTAMLAVPAGAIAAEPVTPLYLTVRLYEKTSTSTKARLLAEPTLSAIPGRPFSFVSGSEFDSQYADEVVTFGTRVSGRFAPEKEGAYPLLLKLSVGHQLSAADDATEVLHEEVFRIGTHLTPGQTKKIPCGNGQWCELQFEKVSPLDPPDRLRLPGVTAAASDEVP